MRWVKVVGLAVLVAIGTGAVGATLAGARRSAGVLERLNAITRPADAYALANIEGFDWEEVRRLPNVSQLVTFAVVYFHVEQLDRMVGGFPPVGDTSQLSRIERPVLVAGRLPDQSRPDEVTIAPEVHAEGVEIGDVLTLDLRPIDDSGTEISDSSRARVKVVGIAKNAFFAWDVQPTAAFWAEHSDGGLTPGYINALVRLRTGEAGIESFARDLQRIAGHPVEVNGVAAGNRTNSRTIDIETAALLVLTIAMATVSTVLLCQALLRLIRPSEPGLGVVALLGTTHRTLWTMAMTVPAVTLIVGVLVSPLVALALSPLFPIGNGRRFEPTPGMRTDWVAWGTGAGWIALACGSAVAVAAWRTTRWISTAPAHPLQRPVRPPSIPRRRLPWGSSVPFEQGVRLALGPGGGRGVAWSVGSGVAVIVAAVTFAGGIDRAVTDSTLFGQHYAVGTSLDQDPALTASEVVKETPASRAGHLRNTVIEIDGVPTSTVSVESLQGSSPLRALSGRLPRRDDEIALSPDAAELLDAGVGDTVPITGPTAPGRTGDEGSRSVPRPRLRVVGVMFVPHTSHTDYTSGAVVTPGLTRRLVEAGAPLKLDAVVWSPTRGTSVGEALASLDRRIAAATDASIPVDRQSALSGTRPLPRWLAAVAAALTLGATTHVLAASARRRRSEVAVMQVLGLTRRQARSITLWHASIGAVVGTALAIPVGFAVGRTLWQATAALLPFRYATPHSWTAVTIASVSVIVLTAIVALISARRSGQAEPSLVLRTE